MRDDLEGWGGGSGRQLKRRVIYVCVHGTDSRCCMRSQHDIVKQLSSNKNSKQNSTCACCISTSVYSPARSPPESGFHPPPFSFTSSIPPDLPLWEPPLRSHICACILVWLGLLIFFFLFFFASTIHLRCRLCQQEKRDLEFRYLVMVFTRFLSPFLSSVEAHTRSLLEMGVRTITRCKLQPPLFCPDAERYSHALCMQRLCIPSGDQWPSI